MSSLLMAAAADENVFQRLINAAIPIGKYQLPGSACRTPRRARGSGTEANTSTNGMRTESILGDDGMAAWGSVGR